MSPLGDKQIVPHVVDLAGVVDGVDPTLGGFSLRKHFLIAHLVVSLYFDDDAGKCGEEEPVRVTNSAGCSRSGCVEDERPIGVCGA